MILAPSYPGMRLPSLVCASGTLASAIALSAPTMRFSPSSAGTIWSNRRSRCCSLPEPDRPAQSVVGEEGGAVAKQRLARHGVAAPGFLETGRPGAEKAG